MGHTFQVLTSRMWPEGYHMRQSRYRTFTSLQKIILHGTRLQRFPGPTLDFKVCATGKNLRNEIYAHYSTQPYWCSMTFNTDIFQRLLQGFHCSESLGNTLPEDSNSLARPDNCHPPLLQFLSISFFCLFWLRVSLWFQYSSTRQEKIRGWRSGKL